VQDALVRRRVAQNRLAHAVSDDWVPRLRNFLVPYFNRRAMIKFILLLVLSQIVRRIAVRGVRRNRVAEFLTSIGAPVVVERASTYDVMPTAGGVVAAGVSSPARPRSWRNRVFEVSHDVVCVVLRTLNPLD